MNKTMIIGNLTKDPELRTVNAGGQNVNVCRLSVAVNERYRDKESTTYFEVTAWRGLADTCAKYLHKGSKIYIDGRISVDAYIDKNGQPKGNLRMSADNIEFLTPRSADGNAAAPVSRGLAANAYAPTQTEGRVEPNYDAPVASNDGFTMVESDELPF